MKPKILRSLVSRNANRSQTAQNLPALAVVGALRCGTNYLKYLIENNYDVSTSFTSFGWKHGGIPVLSHGSGFDYPSAPLAFIVKNPYAFVVSLHRYHMRNVTHGAQISIAAEKEFDAFLCRPVVISDSQLSHSPQMRFHNPLQYWNFIYWNLETLDARRFRTVRFRYEDLIENPGSLRAIERVLPSGQRYGRVVVPEKELKRLDGRQDAASNSNVEESDNFDPTYYSQRRYLDAFDQAQLAFVGREVDPWLMQKFDYDVI